MSKDEVPEYWITYSDLIVSLLMVFALLLFLVLARWQDDVANIAGLRDRANRAVADAAENASRAGLRLELFNGAIVINEDVLFGFASTELDAEGQRVIKSLATEFFPESLSNPDLNSLVEAIEIEGHTDTVGSYMYNLTLSQLRANAVMGGLLEASDSLTRDRLRQLLVASGRSETRPIRVGGGDGPINAARSRRIEIHFRLRNDALVDSIARQFGGRSGND